MPEGRTLAVIGAGKVGTALAAALLGAGHTVVLGAPDRPSAGVARALAAHPGLVAEPAAEAVAEAEAVFLCTPFESNAEALQPVAGALAGRVVVDCTNPVGPGLRHGLGSVRSGAEQVASLAPGALVVKGFSVYGVEVLAAPRDLAGPIAPMMPLAGDDPAAVGLVAGLASDMGWEPVAVGPLSQALHLEHMTLLWVQMVRAGGHAPHLAWAALRA